MINRAHARPRFRIIVPAYPTFNVYSSIAQRTTSLGPVYIATVVNKMGGWDAEVIDENNLNLYGPRNPDGRGADHNFIQDERPADIIGLYGGLTSTIPRLYELAKFYKKKGITIVAGGQHFAGENIEEALHAGIDYLVTSEGEETIKELLPALINKGDISKIDGIAYLKNGKVVINPPRAPITDFNRLPTPDFSLVRYAWIKLFPVNWIRGCGMDCEFCTVKGKPRCAPADKVFEDIKYLLETYDARHFFIVDDLFGQFRTETIHLCKLLRDYQRDVGRRIDLTVQIRLDKAVDSEMLSIMRQAGINSVCIGFESPIEDELKAMSKRVKPEEMIKLARIYHKFGFLVHGMFIFGYPLKDVKLNLTLDERLKAYRTFIKKAKIDTIQILLPVPLPGTEFRKRLEKENRVYPRSEIGWEYYDGNFPLFEPDPPLTAQDLHIAVHKLMGRFYQLKYVFLLGWHVFVFPSLVFFLYNIKMGWKKWYRPWRNALTRFGGWTILKGWKKEFKKSDFSEKLSQAQKLVKSRDTGKDHYKVPLAH
ncbi:MAG: B12-binding domain-containing radical SAM protein [Candidatus Omnitrophica bacterium]|nr:B12-binding domain-containing radical SAM protein [Candidatus Omnitrophota bacterium]